MSKLDKNTWKSWSAKSFEDRYPKVESCVEMDRQILNIQEDILYLLGLNGGSVPHKNKIEEMKFTGTLEQAVSLLRAMLVRKENSFAMADCRNVIETDRLGETAQIFSDSSKKAEDRILGSSKTKQYIYIAVGGATILTALVLIMRK